MNKTAEGHLLKDDCSNYDDSKYKNPSVTVDIGICTIFKDKLHVLVIKRKNPPDKGKYALPGGFVEVEKNETLELTALRELKEETNLDDVYLEQLYTYGDPFRDPRKRIITVAYFALIPYSKLKYKKIQAGDDASDATWISFDDLENYEFAVDHKQILNDLLDRLKGKIWYSDLTFQLLDETFTWGELKKVYEIILGTEFGDHNFRRKIRAFFELEKLPRKKKTYGRPASVLKFKKIK